MLALTKTAVNANILQHLYSECFMNSVMMMMMMMMMMILMIIIIALLVIRVVIVQDVLKYSYLFYFRFCEEK